MIILKKHNNTFENTREFLRLQLKIHVFFVTFDTITHLSICVQF